MNDETNATGLARVKISRPRPRPAYKGIVRTIESRLNVWRGLALAFLGLFLIALAVIGWQIGGR
jgi:hypothetical protein